MEQGLSFSWVPLFVATCVTLTVVVIVTLVRIIRAGRGQALEKSDAIVVFGAAVWNDGPSISLQTRINTAEKVFKEGWAPLVLCSGGWSRGISESSTMRQKLLEAGLPHDAVIPDDLGRTTRETLKSAGLFNDGQWSRVVLISSPYHLHRIAQEARRQGLTPVLSPSVPGSNTNPATRRFLVRQYAREVVAVIWYAIRGWLDVIIRRLDWTRLPSAWRQLHGRTRSVLVDEDRVAVADEMISARIKAALPESLDTHAISTPASGLGRPVPGRVTSNFGLRNRRLHSGIDFRAHYGDPVCAAADGHVIYAGQMGPYGNLVILDHHGGLSTNYAHLTGLIVDEGDTMESGAVIGYAGLTGRTSGPHLHFEVRVHGSPVDPLAYLENDLPDSD